ncbi:MAG: ABC transporter permease [Spirochaetes bacterium]|nr:MAG: ABC transporter permease [Spirochaetota bacterium]
MKLNRSLMRILALADKEWTQIRRDLRSLLLSIGIPALLLLLFGYALTMDVKLVNTAILDQDRSALSRRLVEKFSHTEYLSILRYAESNREVDELIDSGAIVMALVIPPGFEKRFQSGKPADVQLIADGSDSTSSMVSMGYVKSIIFNFNQDMKIAELKRAGLTDIRVPVDVRSRIWYNPELQSKNFIVPGLIAIIMAIISALITSLTISREWERGTMETLITTPVRPYEVFIGKLIPYLLLGMFDIVVTLSIGYFVFGIPLKGSFVELASLALLFLAGTSGLGIMISAATRVQVLSVQVAIMVTYLPSFMLSGFIFPINNMPLVIQVITYVIPAKYLIAIIKGIALKGVGASLLWSQVVFLFLFTALVMAVSIKKFRLTLPEKGG